MLVKPETITLWDIFTTQQVIARTVYNLMLPLHGSELRNTDIGKDLIRIINNEE